MAGLLNDLENILQFHFENLDEAEEQVERGLNFRLSFIHCYKERHRSRRVPPLFEQNVFVESHQANIAENSDQRDLPNVPALIKNDPEEYLGSKEETLVKSIIEAKNLLCHLMHYVGL